MSIASPAAPRWDDAIIAAALQESSFAQQLQGIQDSARQLSDRYRGQVAALTEAEFRSFVEAYQSCVARLQRLTSFAELAAGDGTGSSDATAALGRCDVAWSHLSDTLGFVEPELAALTAMAAGRHRQLRPGGELHTFYRRTVEAAAGDDTVRTVLSAVRPSGIQGWQNLARQLFGRLQVTGPDGTVSVGGRMAQLRHPERRIREQAQHEITAALAAELDLRATALSMIVADGLIRAELTGTSWLEPNLRSDQLSRAEFDALVDGAAAGYPLVHRYFTAKAGLLGLARLDEADRYAPLAESAERISWLDAVDTVLAAFDAVHPHCGEAARVLLSAGRVDAADRPGKPTGPFTKNVPGELPWISVNFDGSLRQVIVLAHELGHGVHMMLTAGLPVLAAATPRVLAETVALFFEAVTLPQLERLRPSSAALAGLTARSLEDQLVAPCRQVAILRFEEALRQHCRAAGPPAARSIGQAWLGSQQELYGDALPLSESFASWWSCLEGPFQSPGSSYAYLYGQFAAAALVERFESAPRSFGDRLLALMAAGGTRSPRELLLLAGVDPLLPETWDRAFGALRRRLETLEAWTAAPTAPTTFEGSAEPDRGREDAAAGRR